MEKRTPPIGEAKQQATPTAQAAASISECLDSLVYMPWKVVTILVKHVATIEAMWTNGPSLPKGIPLPSVAVKPTIFAIKVGTVKYS